MYMMGKMERKKERGGEGEEGVRIGG